MLKRFLKAHDGDMRKAQAALEDALAWHLRMRHLTNHGNRRKFDAALNHLAWVTTSQAGTPPDNTDLTVIIWHIWGAANPKEIFDEIDK